MSDRYSQLVRLPVAGARRRSGSGCRSRSSSSAARREVSGRVLLGGAGRRGRGRGAGAGRAAAPTRRPRSTTRCATHAAARRARRRRVQPRGAGRPARSRRSCSTPPGSPTSADLVELQRFFHPTVAARAAVRARDRARRRAARAGGLHALARQGDRPRGATVNLVHVEEGAEDADRRRRCGSCSRRARRTCPARSSTSGAGDASVPLAGRTALVTGASRGIGAAIADVLEREGASVVRLDLQGRGHRARHHRPGRAGAARRALRRRARHPRPQRGRDQGPHAGQDARGPLAVADGGQPARARADHRRRCCRCSRDDGRIVCVSSLSAIAGNAGQTNYATSKAGLIDLVDATLELERGITINAVAPGLHRDRDDRGDAGRRARGGAADELAAPGRAAGRRGRDGRVAAPAPAWTATSSGCAASRLLGA